MSFIEAHRKVSKYIVAIVSKFHRTNLDFPEVVGTGFIISPEGVVCTCRHVVDELLRQAEENNYDGLGGDVLIYHEVQYHGKAHLAFAPLPIHSYGHMTLEEGSEGYLGPNPPDVSYLLLPLRELPYLSLAKMPLEEGELVAFAGFPMGSGLLRLPGYLERVTPTLHSGIVSAILPDRCAEQSFGFWLHANTQGGASGSPVFREDGSIVGMVYRVARDEYVFGTPEEGYVSYLVPTALTGCVSKEMIAMVIERVEHEAAKVTGRQTFAEVLAHASDIIVRQPGKGIMEPYTPSS